MNELKLLPLSQRAPDFSLFYVCVRARAPGTHVSFAIQITWAGILALPMLPCDLRTLLLPCPINLRKQFVSIY